MYMSGSFITVIYLQNYKGSARTMVYRIRIFNAEKRDNEQLKEYVNALFNDNFSL